MDDERRQISNLICNFIKKIDFGRDFEQQLTFYVEARAAFPNLDSVFVSLVHCVNKLAVDTRCIVHGHHTRKTDAFVKACAAYSYITIPSIVSVMTRMDLYLLAGQVALTNVCLGQGESTPTIHHLIRKSHIFNRSQPMLAFPLLCHSYRNYRK